MEKYGMCFSHVLCSRYDAVLHATSTHVHFRIVILLEVYIILKL